MPVTRPGCCGGCKLPPTYLYMLPVQVYCGITISLRANIMKEMSYTDARQNLAEILNDVAAGEQVEIIRRGKESAYVVNAQEYRAFLKHKLEHEFEEMMSIHGDAIKALADR